MTAHTDIQPEQAGTLSGSAAEGFTRLYGIPVTELGEDSGGLLALGHLTDRAVLAVTNAYHRRVWGYRVRPSSELADLTRFGSRRLHIRVTPGSEDDDYAWQFHTVEPDAPSAQAATLIDVEWLVHEDVAVQSECPACTKASRSTSLITGPGRTGWGHYHRCLACDYAWPAAPEYTPGLTKHGRWSFTRADGCFACSCLPGYPCQDGCTIQPDPLIGQRLCTRCRSQHPHDVWQQLAAVAYGTSTVFDHLDDQRDRWLYSEALRGTSPAQAAQAWQHRLALTAQRAAPRHIEPTAP